MQRDTIVIDLPNVAVKADNFIDDQKKSVNSTLSLIERLIKNAINRYSNKFKIEYRISNGQMEVRITNEQDDWIGGDMNSLIMDEIKTHLETLEKYEEHIVNDELDKAAHLNKEHHNKLKSSYDTLARLKEEVKLECDDKELTVQNKPKLSHESQTETTAYSWRRAEIDKPFLRAQNRAEFVIFTDDGYEHFADLEISEELWPEVFRFIWEKVVVDIEFEVPVSTMGAGKKLPGKLLKIEKSHDLLDEAV